MKTQRITLIVYELKIQDGLEDCEKCPITTPLIVITLKTLTLRIISNLDAVSNIKQDCQHNLLKQMWTVLFISNSIAGTFECIIFV